MLLWVVVGVGVVVGCWGGLGLERKGLVVLCFLKWEEMILAFCHRITPRFDDSMNIV